METPALFVPIHLNALVVGGGEAKGIFRNLALDLDRLNSPEDDQNLGSELSNLQLGGTPMTYQPGVYLHWVLPAAFRQGEATPDWEGLKFPYVPNRWLVVRTNEADLPEINAWIVESDVEDPAAKGSPNWITEQRPDQPYSAIKIGKCTPLAVGKTWKPAPVKDAFLTIMPAGNPDFAASFMHCKDVFGIHDPIASTAENLGKKFSYRVFGWFAASKDDVLANCTTRDKLLAALGKYNWNLSEAGLRALTDANAPRATICHGMVHSLEFAKLPTSRVPRPNNIRLAIGNTTAEAMAALLQPTQDVGAGTLANKLLATYQFDLLKQNGLARSATGKLHDPLEAPQKAMHARAFHAVDGGTVWVLQKKEAPARELPDQPPKVETYLPFGDQVSNALAKLNAEQDEYDRTHFELICWQEQLNAMTYKMVYQWKRGFTLTEGLEVLLAPDGKLEQAIKDLKAKCLSRRQALLGLKPSREMARQQLLTVMADDVTLVGYELKEVPREKYFVPTEPSLVIEGLNPAECYAEPRTGGERGLRCRLATELAANAVVRWDNKPYPIGGGELVCTNKVSGGATTQLPTSLSSMPAALQAIFHETLLLDPLCAGAIAQRLRHYHGSNVPVASLGYASLLERLFAAGNVPATNAPLQMTTSATTLASLPAAFAAAKWLQPWIPLYMEWEVQWEGKMLPTKLEDYWRDWRWGGVRSTADFAWIGTQAGPMQRYAGRTYLSSEMASKTHALGQLLAPHLKIASQAVFEPLTPLAQALSGFTNQLIQRVSAIQLPYIIPIVDGQSEVDKIRMERLFEGINRLIDGQARWIPLLADEQEVDGFPFSPLRGGFLKITNLRVIDTYGQTVQIIDRNKGVAGQMVQSRALKVAANDKAKYLLPPRLVQPARLRFEWLSAQHAKRATDSDPGTSPICGWLLHNKLDATIVVHAADGMELGALKALNGSVQLLPPPGRSKVQIANATLAAFAQALLPKNNQDQAAAVERLAALTRQIEAITQKSPAKASRQGLGLALPIGKPIAVVSARCTLEIRDVLASPQGWYDDPLHDPAKAPLRKLPFGIALGNASSNLDGLVGFFTEGNYASMQLPYGQVAPGGAYLQQQAAFNLCVGQPRQVTCLIDPRMGIGLTSGILPEAWHELPPHVIEGPLKAIGLRFLVGPLLVAPPDPDARSIDLGLTLKDVDGMEWVWVNQLGEDTVIEREIEAKDADRLRFTPLRAMEGFFKLKHKKE